MIIIGKSDSGRTKTLVKEAARLKYQLVHRDTRGVHQALEIAKELKVEILQSITFNQYIQGYTNPDSEGVLFEDLDKCLERYTKFRSPIKGFSWSTDELSRVESTDVSVRIF